MAEQQIERFIVYGGRVTHGVQEARPTITGRLFFVAHCGAVARQSTVERREPAPEVTCKRCRSLAAPHSPKGAITPKTESPE
jgi:hypothetical protein